VAVDIPVNSTTMSSGAHQLRVALTDAAGNSAVVYSAAITADNTVRVPNGIPCDGVQLSLSVNRHPRLGVVRSGRCVLTRGWLRCARTPVPGAQVDVSGGGGKSTSVQTNAEGRFDYWVPIGASRTLTFSYRAYSNDTNPAAIAHVKIRVRPRSRFISRPTGCGARARSTGAGGSPAALPSNRPDTSGRSEVGTTMGTFDQLVTHDGLFAYRYTFRRTPVTTTYAFRVALPVSGVAG
jgi:hypothetical protein